MPRYIALCRIAGSNHHEEINAANLVQAREIAEYRFPGSVITVHPVDVFKVTAPWLELSNKKQIIREHDYDKSTRGHDRQPRKKEEFIEIDQGATQEEVLPNPFFCEEEKLDQKLIGARTKYAELYSLFLYLITFENDYDGFATIVTEHPELQLFEVWKNGVKWADITENKNNAVLLKVIKARGRLDLLESVIFRDFRENSVKPRLVKLSSGNFDVVINDKKIGILEDKNYEEDQKYVLKVNLPLAMSADGVLDEAETPWEFIERLKKTRSGESNENIGEWLERLIALLRTDPSIFDWAIYEMIIYIDILYTGDELRAKFLKYGLDIEQYPDLCDV